MVCQVIATAEKYIRRYGCESFNPSRHETGRDAQENAESLSATFQDGNLRYDTLVNHSIHTNPSSFLPGRCYSGVIAGWLRRSGAPARGRCPLR